MPSDSSVIADPANGAAIVAGTRVTMSAAANGALRFGGPGGRVLRPLTFGERTELVSAASALPAARDAVAAAILTAATVEPGAGAMSLMEVLAMWLAGAAFDAPDFMETTVLVARAAAWPPHELFSAPAREVDRLAVHLDEQRRASEWKSLVFAEPPAETVDAVRARFADRLLLRSAAAAVAEEASEERATGERRSSPQRHTTPIAQQQATHSRDLEEGPSGEAAPAHALTTPTTHARPPLVRGVQMTVPHEDGDHAHRATRTGSVAATPPAFSIRSTTVWSAAAKLPLSKAAAAPPHSKPAAPVVMAESVVVPRVSEVAAAALPHSRPAAQVVMAESVIVPRIAEEATAALSHSGSTAQRAATATTALPHSKTAQTLAGEERESLRFERRPRASVPHAEDLAATLASLLDDEADLRGVER